MKQVGQTGAVSLSTDEVPIQGTARGLHSPKPPRPSDPSPKTAEFDLTRALRRSEPIDLTDERTDR